MGKFAFTYTPENLAYGDKPVWVSCTDGDTPTLQLPLRMLGMDAPEYHYGGATAKNPGKFDKDIASFLTKAGKDLDQGLQNYLKARVGSNASTRQIQAGQVALDHFKDIVAKRLGRGMGKNGKPLTPRHLFTMASKDVFDRYGRLLAYVNASYEKKERDKIPESKRPTFNLQMIQDAQAVSLIIYPNIPKEKDLALVQEAVKNARTHGKGFWKNPDKVLLPYEFRWIVDTIQGKRNGPDRYCADIVSGKLYPPQRYYEVLPENRVFFFQEHLSQAIGMGLILQV
jgi:endonuclease YncB( thermonuclease family)